MQSVNLIPAARRDAKRRRRRRTACAAACGAYAVLLAGALGAAHLLGGGAADGRSSARALARTEDDIQRLERQAAEARTDVARARATLEANRVVAEQPDWSVLLALLARTTGEDVVLRAVSVAPPVAGAAPPTPAAAAAIGAAAGDAAADVVLDVMGVGRSQLAVSRHVLQLEGTGLFAKVTLLDTVREPFLNGPAIAFRLQCTFGRPPQQRTPLPPRAGAPATAAVDAGGVSR